MRGAAEKIVRLSIPLAFVRQMVEGEADADSEDAGKRTTSTVVKKTLMATQIFVNLPGKDFKKSIEFFTKLGFKFNPQYTDETATRMIVGEDIFVMLLTHEKFKLFTLKDICDATRSTEVLVCLALESRDEVDEWSVRRSPAAGPPTMNRRTADSCLATDFRTAMATSGD